MTTAQKLKVFITRKVPESAVKLLQEKFDVILWNQCETAEDELALLGSVHALLVMGFQPINVEFLNKTGSNLKIISTMSVGYDHIDVAECRKRGILLGYTPNVLDEATAELTLALLLATSRRVIEANKAVYSGAWGPWDPLWMCGKGLHNSTVGIVGLGRIGSSVAEKIKAFKPKALLYYGRSPNAIGDQLGAKFVSFDQLLSQSDFVVITCALNEQTRHLFNRSAFDKMKPNAILVNTSRGGLIDQDALYDVLLQGKIAAAGLDVCTPEPLPVTDKLLTLPNIVVLPHIGSAETETRTRMATLSAENIIAALENRPLSAEIPFQ